MSNGRLKTAGRGHMLVEMSRKATKARAAKAAAPAAPPKRASKRDAVLAEAAVQFNARGIAGTALAEIATKLELTRAALYYYVDDRDDLVFQTYLRSCEITAEDLEGAFEEGRNGLERVLAYVGRALDAERAPAAVLSEVPYLTGSPRAIVEKAQRRNIEALQRFVAEGIADKSIRACDASLAAHTIVGLVSWAPLWPDWLGGDAQTPRNFRKRVAAATRDLLSDGLAADPAAPIRCPINVETFRPRPANVFDKRDAQAMKIEQIAMTASRLFNQQGIDGTSLDQICDELGTTKGALYHYFNDKQELVVHCYKRGFGLFEAFVDTAAQAGKSGLERGAIGLHLNVQAQASTLSPLMPQPGLEALPARDRNEVTRRALAIEQKFEGFGRQGRADGSYRDCDLDTVALAGAGVFAWIPKWYAAGDPRSPWQVADETMDIFTRGLRRR
jgi:AcrR family transcriptional regulator